MAGRCRKGEEGRKKRGQTTKQKCREEREVWWWAAGVRGRARAGRGRPPRRGKGRAAAPPLSAFTRERRVCPSPPRPRLCQRGRAPAHPHTPTRTRPAPLNHVVRVRCGPGVVAGRRRGQARAQTFQWGAKTHAPLSPFSKPRARAHTHTGTCSSTSSSGTRVRGASRLRSGVQEGGRGAETKRARGAAPAPRRRLPVVCASRPHPPHPLLPIHRRRQVLPAAPVHGQAVPAGARPDHRRRVW